MRKKYKFQLGQLVTVTEKEISGAHFFGKVVARVVEDDEEKYYVRESHCGQEYSSSCEIVLLNNLLPQELPANAKVLKKYANSDKFCFFIPNKFICNRRPLTDEERDLVEVGLL